MRLTATNGNPRNRITGQRLTVTLVDGSSYSTTLPGQALGSQKHRARILDFIHSAAIVEAGRRYGPGATPNACRMVDLFARCKARMLVTHRRVFA